MISIMLGRLRRSIDECIDVYLSLFGSYFPEGRTPGDDKGQHLGRAQLGGASTSYKGCHGCKDERQCYKLTHKVI